ncbi:phosphoenolpyruvate synthase [Chitinophaga filiformis]|uniref:Phosphoenolpyruvate synthase n=1 Tax=Chitinophaga filiformis TaxID=104663 RepID=A0ABY4I9D9_CHIFI|nr:phosphoenolpyruvate synthase [Chitinophaga filiformis]UPK72723.1 phosphoenolpyruvate synthase [Chitinophaga filiformis]
MEALVKGFAEISMQDVAQVGGKNASMGEMMKHLTPQGINIPGGFATTAFAYWTFLDFNNLWEPLEALMGGLDRRQFNNLKETGAAARQLILQAEIPDFIVKAIKEEYARLCTNGPAPVAVRSSATAEDMPYASFAGQHESFLNVKGEDLVVEAVLHCYSSLYTDRAIKYREDNGIEHKKVALCACIQKMVRSDLAGSGVAFTLEPESGFRDLVLVSGTWGLGENIVQGSIEPDEYYVFKPTLRQGKQPIIQRKLGSKQLTMKYANDSRDIVNVPTPEEQQHQPVLTDAEVIQLARWGILIEEHYKGPMDIEWAKDGLDGKLYIVQARPETVHSRETGHEAFEYRLKQKGHELLRGQAIGSMVVTGIARVLASPAEGNMLKDGEIIVTRTTSPDWDPLLKKAGAIITDSGGRTSHAAIVAREQHVPAIVGCGKATELIVSGMVITVSCCEGKEGVVYEGAVPYEKVETDFSHIKSPGRVKPMLIMSDPGQAFKLAAYPAEGVGLLRMEFIITHTIGIHPMALVRYPDLKDDIARKQIRELTTGFDDKKRFFIERLSQGIATIAAAFYPREVIVRMSDFKTNEYAALTGGMEFEPDEENPMLGFRGASRYYHPAYKAAFGLECAAIKTVRNDMGLTNVKVMIPFCRTVAEGSKVLSVMEEYGLKRGVNGLEVYVMAEIPSNVVLAEKFAAIFDGFSIGSNDLTQLTLGIDRDSSLVATLFNEEDQAVESLLSEVIKRAIKCKRPVGLCGQAPSDLPAFTAFLVRNGISSISFNPDALLRGIENIVAAEDVVREDQPGKQLVKDDY